MSQGTGLDKPALMELIGAMFPDSMSDFAGLLDDTAIVIDAEEQSVRDILGMFSTGAGRLERYLAAVIARRCKSPHHLWQDLGLRDRDELSRLMKRHFARLSERNQQNMKWKKFLYRMVCRSEGFSLCTAPVCSECSDFDSCFGAEDGGSRALRTRTRRRPKRSYSIPCSRAFHIAAMRNRSLMAAGLARISASAFLKAASMIAASSCVSATRPARCVASGNTLRIARRFGWSLTSINSKASSSPSRQIASPMTSNLRPS